MSVLMGSVLVVDDTPSVRAALRRILRRAGYEVIEAESGPAALSVARQHDLVAALVDYQMPGMDGLTLLDRLRTIHPALPAVLVSGALDLDVVMRAVNRGDAMRVLAKPVRAADVVAAVDGALRRNEIAGRRWVEGRDAARGARRAALAELLDGDGVRLALQPIVGVRAGRPVAWEGLLRTRGILDGTPGVLENVGHVLEAAEEDGRLGDVTEAVARKAADWLRFLPATGRLFLNIHPRELDDAEALTDALGPVRSHASRIVVEVTERATLGLGWERTIDALRADGFGIAIDDLGAGASSLVTLAELDPDVMKIDRALVSRVDREPRKRRVVEMLAQFASATGVEMVAEGIEEASEAETIRGLGVDLMQGYHFGRPSAELDVVLGDIEPQKRDRLASGTRLKKAPRSVEDERRDTGTGD